MKKQLLALVALCAVSVWADVDQNVQNDEPVLLPLTNLVWRCGPNARIENGILTVDVPPEYPVLQIDRAVVRARIASRLDDMFLAGLEDEKRRLHELYPVWSRTASLAIGYRDGDDRGKILTRTCQLAKRQDTWFRHQATPLYVEPTVESVRECWRTRGPWHIAIKINMV